ncbi:transposase, partial [Psychrobacter faecalis]|uniref:transposase n=1 Tax=Psychrobacter faecalis TaxID=180588 RepID=UPI003FD21468
SYIDSTKIAVCHNKRIYRHKVFEGLATRGKSSMGWFYGFKLHAIINHKGELVSVKVTAGNTDDSVPVKDMATSVFGKVFGDRGYISKALNA